MEFNGSLTPGPYYITNLNDRNYKQLNLELVKQEIPDIVDVHLESIQGEGPAIKSETVTTEDEFKSTISSTLDTDVISNWPMKLKSETPAQDCWLENDHEISAKQELLHEELNIKSEDEAIQETHVDDNCKSKHPSEVEPFKCNICDYTCRHKSILERHLRTHTREKPFKCTVCDCSYTQSGSLKNHLITHTGEKPFKCNVCNHSFARKGYFKDHLRIHTGEKLFKCNICNFGFARSSYLKIHLRTHTGERPFKCNICEHSCSQEGHLKIHLRTHTGEKPIKCNICDFSCRQHFSLRRHLRTHTGEKPFKCNVCDYRSTQKSNLNMHLQRFHRS